MGDLKMTKEKKQKIAELRQAWKKHYLNKYMDMWIRNFEAEGLTEEESDFILKSFWFQGCAAAIRFEGGVLGYVQVAPQDWNVYNFPTAGVPINNRGVPYIRQTFLRNAFLKTAKSGARSQKSSASEYWKRTLCLAPYFALVSSLYRL